MKVIGEVIEAHTTRFAAQCPPDHLHAPPRFGSFVKIPPPRAAASERLDAVAFTDPFADAAPSGLPPDTAEGTIYALVTSAGTASAEPGRRPAAYGLHEDELRAEQPQIFDLLVTEFRALHIGYAEGDRLRPYLPPRPPRLHAFVEECTPAEVCALTESPDLLRRLLRSPLDTDPDELIAACLRHAYLCRREDFGFLVRMGKRLAQLLRDDPERLSSLLRKLEP